MGVYGGPEIANDGLALALDAGNSKSYLGSGTTWNDLSGRSNGVILNGSPAFDSNGSIIFNGTTSQYGSKASVNLPTGDATILCWVYPDSTGPTNAYTGLVAWGGRGNVTPSNATLLCLRTDISTWTVGSAYWNNDYNPGNSAVSVNKDAWNLIGIVARSAPTSNNTTLFKFNSNGYGSITGSSSAFTRGINRTNVNLTVGCTDTTGGRPMKGKISSVMIYDRELSLNEIQQNFIATKSRFGL
jgi:hypothetical protein